MAESFASALFEPGITQAGSARVWPKVVAEALSTTRVLASMLERWQGARLRLGLSPAAETLGAVVLVAEVSSTAYRTLVGDDATRRALARAHVLAAAGEVLDAAAALGALVELEERRALRAIDVTGPWFAGEVALAPALQTYCIAGAPREPQAQGVESRNALSLRVAERIDELIRFVSSRGESNVFIVVRGQRGSGRDTAVRLILSKLGREPLRRAPFELRAELDGLEPELSGAVPIWDCRHCDPSPEDRALAARWLGRAPGASIAVLERDQDPPDLDRLLLPIDLDPQNGEERQQIWSRALLLRGLEPDADLARRMAHRTRAGSGLAVRAAEMCRRQRQRQSANEISSALEQELVALGSQGSIRGVVVERPNVAWSRLVISGATQAGLEQLRALARLREARESDRKGLRALFAGPPGTGKTLAARATASVLGLLLYRVDLAAMVSKWVGETEKNLRQVLTVAAAAGALLLFDEGDALLAKRGDVTRGSDRYANHEVSYLLQALEEHDGVVVVGTNLKHNLDAAFLRRFDVSVDFTLPSPVDRRQLWLRELGEPLPAALDSSLLDELAGPELSGGNIATAARLSSALAHERGSAAPTRGDLRRAVAAEFYKLGSAVQGAQWVARAERGDSASE